MCKAPRRVRSAPAALSVPSNPVQSLSVEQDEGFQLLGNVPPVVEAVLDDGPGSEALQRGVVDGLDDVPGQLLLVQEVAGRLLEGVGAVEVIPAGNQQVHDVGVTVGCGYVEGAAGKMNKIVRLCHRFIPDRVYKQLATVFALESSNFKAF